MLTGNDGLIILVDKHSVYVVYKISSLLLLRYKTTISLSFFFFFANSPISPLQVLCIWPFWLRNVCM